MSAFFFGVMGAPFEDETTTTLLRMVDAALDEGHEVVVWACGGATLLTQERLGLQRPRDLLALGTDRSDREHPTTAALIKRLLARGGQRLRWLVCRHCMEERGADKHIEGVRVTSPFKYLSYLETADVCLTLGRK